MSAAHNPEQDRLPVLPVARSRALCFRFARSRGERSDSDHRLGRPCHAESQQAHWQQFTVPLLMELFDRARGMERVVARGGALDYQNRIMASLFYAPSTGTRFSFEAAMHRLGGRVLSTEQARVFFFRNRR